MTAPHVTIEPSILYFGTPVVLISTQNEDGTANLAPMSSARWLGWRFMPGLQTASQTPQNMIRAGQCVLNLASPKQPDAVKRMTRSTGTETIPDLKQRLGYVYEPGKFEAAGLDPHRIAERGAALRSGISHSARSSCCGASRHDD